MRRDQARAAAETSAKDLVERIQKSLGDKLKEVRVTHRLTDSPSCLVSEADGMSLNLERILKASGQKVPTTLPTLEINPTHPLIEAMTTQIDRLDFIKSTASTLMDLARLQDGEAPTDPAAFAKRITTLLAATIHTSHSE